MLLHYPHQYENHSLPIHYQPFDTSTSIHPRNPHLPSATSIPLPHHLLPRSHLSMPTSEHPSNPTVRVHQSTPSPESGAQSHGNQLMLAQSAFSASGWGNDAFPTAPYLDTLSRKTERYHKRLPSTSSTNSAGPPSPHDQPSPFCQIANTDSSHFSPLENFDCVPTPQKNHFSKSLPTPVGTPTSNILMPPGYQTAAAAQDNHGYSAYATRRIQSTTGDDNRASIPFSGQQSV